MGPLCWPEVILGVLSWHAGQVPGGHPEQRGPAVRAFSQVLIVQSPGRGLQGSLRVGGSES